MEFELKQCRLLKILYVDYQNKYPIYKIKIILNYNPVYSTNLPMKSKLECKEKLLFRTNNLNYRFTVVNHTENTYRVVMRLL